MLLKEKEELLNEGIKDDMDYDPAACVHDLHVRGRLWAHEGAAGQRGLEDGPCPFCSGHSATCRSPILLSRSLDRRGQFDSISSDETAVRAADVC